MKCSFITFAIVADAPFAKLMIMGLNLNLNFDIVMYTHVSIYKVLKTLHIEKCSRNINKQNE